MGLSKKDFIVVFNPHMWGLNTTKNSFCGSGAVSKASFGTAPQLEYGNGLRGGEGRYAASQYQVLGGFHLIHAAYGRAVRR